MENIKDQLKVCVISVGDLDIRDKDIMGKSDEEFLEMAEEIGSVYSLVGFQHKFNLDEPSISSETAYIRIIECNK